jgi:hypothetical protein
MTASIHAFARSHPYRVWLCTALAVGPVLDAADLWTVFAVRALDLFLLAIGMIMLGVLFIGSVAILLAVAAQRRLELTRRRAAITVCALVAAGSLPWMLPEALVQPSTLPWRLRSAAWAVDFAVWAVAVLATIPQRRTHVIAGIGALAIVVLWLPIRTMLISAGDTSTLHRLGNPPRTLLRLVDWPLMSPGTYTYTSGVVTLEYDADTILPVPDDTGGGLLVEQWAGQNPCTVPIKLTGLSDCRQVGPGLWLRTDGAPDDEAGCAAVMRSDQVLVEVWEDDCTGGGNQDVQNAVTTQHGANGFELLSLAP